MLSITAGRNGCSIVVTRACDLRHTSLVRRTLQGRSAQGCVTDSRPLGRVVKVHNVLRHDGHSITPGGAEVPALQHREDLLLDAVTDALKQFRSNHIALRVDGDLHDHVPLHAGWQIAAGHRGIRENFWQSRYDLIARDWRTGYPSPGRTAACGLLRRVLLSWLIRFGRFELRFGRLRHGSYRCAQRRPRLLGCRVALLRSNRRQIYDRERA